MNEVAESGALIHLSVAEKELPSVLAFFEGKEHGLYHIFHIDKCDVLPLIAYGKVTMPLDTLGHHEVILLSRTVDARRSKNNIR